MKKNLLPQVLGLISSMLLFSCVRDTDFNQVNDVALTPVVELDLIHFDLDAGDFFDAVNGVPRLTVTDTTEIRFLDDTEIQESLFKAEFLFVFTNSIPRTFQTDFIFLSETGDVTYTTSTSVSDGLPNNPIVTEFSEVVEFPQILDLTQANRVVVSVTIPSSDISLQGGLSLKSKTTYYLEIKDRN
jgi:hypothetical protein